MLQSVPDPFDSYGPPPAEDQIFSILPPLSVIANAPSSTPSPLTSSTPELEGSSDGIASGKSSWAPATGTYFSESSAAWADVATSPTSTSLPVSPTRTVSPPDVSTAFSYGTTSMSAPSTSNSNGSRRHSHPASSFVNHHQRRSESKLRSVLSVIDESQNQSHSNGGSEEYSGDNPASSSSARANGSSNFDSSSVAWGALKLKLAEHSSNQGDDDITPRNSILVRAQSPSSFSSETPHAERSRSPRSDDASVPITI